MERLYYLTRSLHSVLGINRDLRAAGIGGSRIHVTGKNLSALEAARVPTTTLVEETDVLHSGFVGALYGMLGGALLGLILAGWDPWGRDLGSGTLIVATLFFTCFGAWLGGIYGISMRNHHLAPYLASLDDAGSYLVMVDADDERQVQIICNVMEKRHREAKQAGHEEHYSPFL